MQKQHISIVHTYPSPIVHETRIFKQTTSICRLLPDTKCVIIGLKTKQTVPEESISDQVSIKRVKTLIKKHYANSIINALLATEWSLRVFWSLRKRQIDIFCPHNLATLPLAIVMKWTKGCKVIYETHEFETERVGWPATIKSLGRFIERQLISFADEVVVVSDGMRASYRDRYPNIDPTVIKNMPSKRMTQTKVTHSGPTIKRQLGIKENEILFLYQGVFGAGRGLEPVIDHMQSNPNQHLLILGFSDNSKIANRFESVATKTPNIHLLEAVPQNQLMSITSGCDVGLHLFEAIAHTYEISVGNKFYEYINAGVPVLASSFPEIDMLVEKHNLGWTIKGAHQFTKFAQGVNTHQIKSKKFSVAAMKEKFTWETQEKDYVGIYRKTLGGMSHHEKV